MTMNYYFYINAKYYCSWRLNENCISLSFFFSFSFFDKQTHIHAHIEERENEVLI